MLSRLLNILLLRGGVISFCRKLGIFGFEKRAEEFLKVILEARGTQGGHLGALKSRKGDELTEGGKFLWSARLFASASAIPNSVRADIRKEVGHGLSNNEVRRSALRDLFSRTFDRL